MCLDPPPNIFIDPQNKKNSFFKRFFSAFKICVGLIALYLKLHKNSIYFADTYLKKSQPESGKSPSSSASDEEYLSPAEEIQTASEVDEFFSPAGSLSIHTATSDEEEIMTQQKHPEQKEQNEQEKEPLLGSSDTVKSKKKFGKSLKNVSSIAMTKLKKFGEFAVKNVKKGWQKTKSKTKNAWQKVSIIFNLKNTKL